MYKTERGHNRAIVQQALDYIAKAAPSRFACFVLAADPDYRMQWFHRLIADKCQAVADGTIRKLMIFVPPQFGKSELISRKFPAWILGRNPGTKLVCCSYSASLSTTFSRSVQRLMMSEPYHRIFPAAALGERRTGARRTADYFDTPSEGFYKAVGVGGSLTGTPADIAIIDDPVKDAAEAYSITYRERVWEWYNSVLTTRLHNDSRQIFIMTRWHEDDLAGRILRAEPDEWEVLTIPALCEEERDGGLSDRHVGESLWEDKHSRAKLLAQQARAPREFAALYQQRPSIEGGNIVRREWFGHISYEQFRQIRGNQPVHYYLDTAYNKRKRNVDNDPSGILAATTVGPDIYIIHAAKVWMEMPDLLRWLPQYMSEHWATEASRLNIEPKANGISVVQMLREQTTINVRQTPAPTEDKEVRLRVVSPRIECGRVILVDGPWTEEFLAEVTTFPTAPHDEYVDILGYAINDLYRDADTDYQELGRYSFI